MERTPNAPPPRGEPLDPQLGFPEDPDLERKRLIEDAKARGVDPEAALAVARELATAEAPAADDYRAVDRRLASGYSIEETEKILVDHDLSPTSHSSHEGDESLTSPASVDVPPTETI